jgi:hypothetical protein
MVKEVGAFSLIIFLFVILASWWAISAFRPPQGGQRLAYSDMNVQYVQTEPVTIYHTTSRNMQVYKGSVAVPSCSQFRTGISAVGSAPAHLRLTFTVAKGGYNCTNPNSVTSVPFSVSYSAGIADPLPVLDSVQINNTAATFSVIESH